VKYILGSVCVDADARSISIATRSLHLTRKAFDLLLLLLEHRPNAVSKEQIHARLWPDSFVAESSLQALIHEIRQVIDHERVGQSWIRTVHGIGYSLAGDVVASDAPLAPARREHPAAWLVGESTRATLHAGENIVGRGLDDVIEIESPTISRRHARITVGDSVTLEDLGSKNGTWLNGEHVTAPRALAEGDIVRLGSATFTFHLARRPKATESADIRGQDVDESSG